VPLTANLTTLLKDLYKVCYLLEPHVVLAKENPFTPSRQRLRPRADARSFRDSDFMTFRHHAVTNMQITGHKTLDVFKRYNSLLEGDLKDAAHCLNSCLALAP
jgi:hypothetical protein